MAPGIHRRAFIPWESGMEFFSKSSGCPASTPPGQSTLHGPWWPVRGQVAGEANQAGLDTE